MTALGYERYGASGGDIAARVEAWMGAQEPDAIIGLHLSCNAISSPSAPEVEADAEQVAWLAREAAWWDDGGGYEHIQRTRPRTLAVALNDSPVGAAAWMIEKWSAWAGRRRRSDRSVRRRRAVDARDAALVRGNCRQFRPDLHRRRGPTGDATAGRPGESSRRVLPLRGRAAWHPAAELRRTAVRGRALERATARRPLSTHRGTGAVRRRSPRVLPST